MYTNSNNLKTIRIRFFCGGLEGCKKNVDIDYKISESSYERMMNDDPWLEKTVLFGGIKCPVCGSCYMFEPSKLKSYVIS